MTRRLSVLTIAALTASVLPLTVSTASADEPKTCATAMVWNHRGDSSTTQTPVTENTLQAAATTASYGVGMETDVWQSKDPSGPELPEFFINHDNTWTRTSQNSTGSVAQMTPAQNRAVILKDGTSALTFDQMLQQVASTGSPIIIDLKNNMNWPRLYAAITARIPVSQIMVTSQTLARVRSFHDAYPDVPSGFIAEKITFDKASVKAAGGIVLLPAKVITPSVVTANTAYGIRTISKVASGGSQYASVLAAGADLIVEGSASYRSWCNSQ